MVTSPVYVLTSCARYWETIHGQWAILDPSFHTMTCVRRRSALLTTVILALASTTLTYTVERSHTQVTEALSLHAHIDRLIWVIFATGARSIEIVQAHIVSEPRTSLCNSRRQLTRWEASLALESRGPDPIRRITLVASRNDSKNGY